jgi:hypothetical protein
VILDPAGGVHSLSRAASVKVGELRDRLKDCPLENLPTVEVGRESIKAHQQERQQREKDFTAAAHELTGEQQRPAPDDTRAAFAALLEQNAEREAFRQKTAEAIRAAWQSADRDGLAFMVNLSEQGLRMAHGGDKGGLVAMAENGSIHSLSAKLYGDEARAMREAIHDTQGQHTELLIPTVEECRRDLAAAREAQHQAREER